MASYTLAKTLFSHKIHGFINWLECGWTKLTGKSDTFQTFADTPTVLAFMKTPIFCFFAQSMFVGYCSIQE